MGKDFSEKAQKLQNRTRIITHSSNYIRSRNILSGLGWKDLYEGALKITWLHKTMNAQVPEYISKMFITSSDVHSYSLRHA